MHMMDVVLSMDQVDDPPPPCPKCAMRGHPPSPGMPSYGQMRQEFKPFAIGGSATAKAHALAEDIAANDYNVGDIQIARKEGDNNKVRYKDQSAVIAPSQWTVARDTLEHAIASGRQSRLRHGSGLDVLQENLKSGAEPDLIENSKRQSIKVW